MDVRGDLFLSGHQGSLPLGGVVHFAIPVHVKIKSFIWLDAGGLGRLMLLEELF